MKKEMSKEKFEEITKKLDDLISESDVTISEGIALLLSTAIAASENLSSEGRKNIGELLHEMGDKLLTGESIFGG